MFLSVNVLEAVVMAIIQGITELFPISSLGHAVIAPHAFGWSLDEESTAFLPFLVMLHLGTATALLIYFWGDWWSFLMSIVAPARARAAAEEQRLLTLLVVGTIPAGLLGLIFEHRLKTLFGDYHVVSALLALNGVLLLAGEWLRRRERLQHLTDLRVSQAVMIGAAQAIALFPGFSRSGASMVGGLAVGLTHESAARFSFLLATPIIYAAGVLEVPKLLHADTRGDLGPALLGGIVAGVVAYVSVAALMRYFHRTEINALIPFGLYCMVAGLLALVLL